MPDDQQRGRDRAASEDYYRRALAGRDLVPALGAAVAAGIAAFYVVRVLTQRTPLVIRTPGRLDPAGGEPGAAPRRRRVRDHG